MMLRFSAFLAPLLLTLLPLGCVGTETGNPEVAQMSLALVSRQPDRISVGDSSLGMTPELLVSSGGLVVDSLTLLPCSSSESPTTLAFPGDATATENRAEVPVGDYCGVTLERSDDFAPRLEFSAIASETEQRIEFQVAAQQGLSVRSEAAFTIEEGTHLIIGIDLAHTIGESALSDLNPNQQDGVVVVDEENNAWLAEEISMQLPGSIGLYIDENADGILQPGELELSLL